MCTFREFKNLIKKKKRKRRDSLCETQRRGEGGRVATAGFERVYSNDTSVEPATILAFTHNDLIVNFKGLLKRAVPLKLI